MSSAPSVTEAGLCSAELTVCLFSGVVASVARLGYQIPEAKKHNQTIIVMILSLMKYALLHHIAYPITQPLTSLTIALRNNSSALSSPACLSSPPSTATSPLSTLSQALRAQAASGIISRPAYWVIERAALRTRRHSQRIHIHCIVPGAMRSWMKLRRRGKRRAWGELLGERRRLLFLRVDEVTSEFG